ncbi:MAG TPA: AAA family ATPase [Chloroflexota bacterium]|nr:AAA family ATPase [Chloroflexota bacterium]
MEPTSAPSAALPIEPLTPERLRWRCDPDSLPFETTAEVPPLDHTVGQDRGVSALEFGLEQRVDGYNVYVAGPVGSGRMTTVRTLVERLAASQPPPDEWCYARNFADPYRPKTIRVPQGKGAELARDMDALVDSCRREIRRAFESEQYPQRRTRTLHEFERQRDAIIDALRPYAQRLGFMIELGPTGIAAIPAISPGVPMSPEAFNLLPEEKKMAIQSQGQQLQGRIDEALGALHRLDREAHEALHRLDQEVALAAVAQVFEHMRAKWKDQPEVLKHLDETRQDLIDFLDAFRATDQDHEGRTGARPAHHRYGVNLLVPNPSPQGAPVVFEPNPTYYNLVGRIDYEMTGGGMYTDFSLIKPGALHRANGGFLILQARDLLSNPFSWEALKRALRDRQVRTENLSEQLSFVPTTSLKPEPIPLQVKVILIGDPTTYRLLYRLDVEFRTLFKVKAEFSPVMDLSVETQSAYAAFVSSRVRALKLLPFRKDAVARILEQGARLVEHQSRLTTRFEAIDEIVVEADAWARRVGADNVLAEHVERALKERDYRVSLVEEEMQRMIGEGTIVIDTESHVVGQINGLSVFMLDDYEFARPTRITAQTGMGADGIVDIQREIKLSGPTHSKGVLILTGYMTGTYARDHPLAFSARLSFEQVYDEVEGDSASSAELYALLSSLAELPIRQDIAVTGSVNQRGEVQAVGGVTTKVEGFYEVCKARGLNGRQGVIIPEANVRHLMLKQEVVDAVAKKQFNVWAVRTIDQGLEILTGIPAGAREATGYVPPDSAHARVEAKLVSLAEGLAAFRGRDGAGDGHVLGSRAGQSADSE